MYIPAAGTPQGMAYSMAQKYRLQMGAADMPGMPQDRLAMNTYTSTQFRQPESGFRSMFRQVADFFQSFSSIASLVGMFYPPVAAVSAVTEAISPAVGMAVSNMDRNPPPMVAVTTNQRYMPNFR
jgi:hypothetical protein